MTTDTAELEKSLVGWVVDWIEEGDIDIDPDTDLLEAGLVDSMGLVGLVTFLEEQTGAEFDFATFDPGEGASVRGLVRHCLST